MGSQRCVLLDTSLFDHRKVVSQDGQEDRKVKFLDTEQGVCISSPLPSLDIEDVAEDHKSPSSLIQVSSVPFVLADGYLQQGPTNRRSGGSSRRYCGGCWYNR